MIGKAGEKLDHEDLARLCHERQLRHRQNTRDVMNSNLAEIARDSISEEDASPRPYGVEREGEAYDVVDTSAIKELWKVSDVFRDILRGRCIETRLPEIVKLVLEKRPHYLLPDNAESNWKMSTFLSLRLVSIQCRRSLEGIPLSKKCELTCLRIDRVEKVVRILNRFVGTSPSFNAASFFLFNLVVDDKEEVGPYSICRLQFPILMLLKVAGHRIHFFSLKSFVNRPHEIYDCLQCWAEYMPNLTHLCLGHHRQMMEDRSTTLREIEPFRGLPNLRCYEESEGELPAIYLQRILEACPGIKDLRLKREHSPRIQVVESLGNLTSLQIHPRRSLLDNHRLPWKLRRLSLCNYDDNDEERIAFSTLLNFLKQFEETLEHLEVNVVTAIDFCEFLELRNLKILKMQLHKSFENLNFLLYAERLESVYLMIERDFDGDMESDVELRGMVEQSFLGMSVWQVFPNLKSYRLKTESRNGAKAVVEKFRMVP